MTSAIFHSKVFCQQLLIKKTGLTGSIFDDVIELIQRCFVSVYLLRISTFCHSALRTESFKSRTCTKKFFGVPFFAAPLFRKTNDFRKLQRSRFCAIATESDSLIKLQIEFALRLESKLSDADQRKQVPICYSLKQKHPV